MPAIVTDEPAQNTRWTKYATVRYCSLCGELLDDVCAKVDGGIEQVSAYLRATPPQSIEVRLSRHPGIPVARRAERIVLGRFEQKPTKRTKGELPSLFAWFPSVEMRQFISLMGADFFSCISSGSGLHFRAPWFGGRHGERKRFGRRFLRLYQHDAEALDRMTRSAVRRVFQCERPWRAPRHRSACR